MPDSPTVVLVVEDEAFIRMIAADTLAENGFAVIEAEDAATALGLLDEHSEVRVMFTDINMPGDINGLDLAEIVATRRPEIRLIVTSGARRLETGDLPDNGIYLAKPYRPAELAAVVRGQIQP